PRAGIRASGHSVSAASGIENDVQGAAAHATLQTGLPLLREDRSRNQSRLKVGRRTPRPSPQLPESHGPTPWPLGQLRPLPEIAIRTNHSLIICLLYFVFFVSFVVTNMNLANPMALLWGMLAIPIVIFYI